MERKPRIFQVNKTSILIEFDEDVNASLLKFLLNLKTSITENKSKLILQVINTYNSLLIIYKFTINNFYKEKLSLYHQISKVELDKPLQSKIKTIPVCYDDNYAWDLESLSNDLRLTKDEIIQRHSSVIYTVYFIGFLPGFPYLGGLDTSLFHRRKSHPRLKIPIGSVGIADTQTGIYPSESPGGWQIIGRSPIRLFDLSRKNHPCWLTAGDKVKFEPITKEKFEAIDRDSTMKI